jgi:hypothetical protein
LVAIPGVLMLQKLTRTSALAGAASVSGAEISPAATAIFKNADFIN